MMRQKILIVEDEKLIRWSIARRLTKLGYDVATAETGEEALDQLATASPDGMLLDVRLPGVDGVEVLQRALQMMPELTVVMMSAHSTIDIAVDAMKRGAIDFLVKPFPLDALELAMERALSTARIRRELAGLRIERRCTTQEIHTIVGESPQMQEVRRLVARAAEVGSATCLIEGESGTGKEVVARAVHFASDRAEQPFLQLNCAALPEHLIESELFGHEKGAFTSADVTKRGLFEMAAGGTVMLDEIGDLAPAGQAKLLNLLENRSFRRVGGVTEHETDVRIIAATNVDLDASVEKGKFRADLFFRLNVVRIHVPPLKEHADDIPLLAEHFLARLAGEMNRPAQGFSPHAIELLKSFSWPGNVRQLRNAVERALILNPSATTLRPEHFGPELTQNGHNRNGSAARIASAVPVFGEEGMPQLGEQERTLITKALDKCGGNQSKAARLLGISRDQLRYRMRKYEL